MRSVPARARRVLGTAQEDSRPRRARRDGALRESPPMPTRPVTTFRPRRRLSPASRDLSAVMRAIREFAEAETPDEMLTVACRELATQLESPACSISRLEGGLLLTAAEIGLPSP